ncbi:hypothetical protein EKK58_05815 [Candidatus Dependentiae bacterium]|nr:MAG: hypothetical protein EKK58_05815 [Candidatus Dependentiae bacterium]
MTLPTLVKTWEFIPNYAQAATGVILTTNRTLLKWLVDNMTTNAAGLWVNASNSLVTPSGLATVRYSCNSTVAGSAGDGVNRWASLTDLVWNNAGSAHSWMVLRMYNTAELLISCEGSAVNGQNLVVATSPSAGFTGGTKTARPTATDERVIVNNTTWGGVVNSDASVKVHLLKSTDGQAWRWLIGNTAQIGTAWIFGKAVQFNPTAWPNSFTMFGIGGSPNTGVLTQTNLNTNANFLGYGASAMAMYLGGMAFGGAQANVTITSASDLSGNWPFLPQELFSSTTSNRGAHGYLSDVWYGSTTTATGASFPLTGDQHQFAQFGSLILPWCRTAPVVT